MSDSKFTYRHLKNYLNDVLSNKERNALEKKALQDPFDADALEGLETLSAQELDTDMSFLKQALTNRTKKTRRSFPIFKIAASILLVVGLGSLLYTINTSKNAHQKLTKIEDSKENSDYVFIDPRDTHFDTLPPQIDSTQIVVQDQNFDIDYSVKEENISITPHKTPKSVLETKNKKAASNKIKSSDIIKDEEITIKAITKKNIDTIQVSGIVTDSNGTPLPGAEIKIIGTNITTTTDFDGKFTLISPKKASLAINYIGFKKTAIRAEDQIAIILHEDISELEEVQIIGYSATKRAEQTGVISSIKSEKIQQSKAIVIEETLSEKVAGVQVEASPQQDSETMQAASIPPNGSIEAFKTWVYKQLDPSIFKANKSYSINTSFTVNTKGGISNIKILTKLDRSIKKELKKVLLLSPNWKPAYKNAEAVDEEVKLVFKIN